ncbi:MAG: DUF5615 family PIN-like protein [Acidobacteriota bacterium]
MIRFQADADLNRRIIRAVLRLEPTIDIRPAAEAGLRGLSDPEVLALAAEAGRLLVTHDQRTMPAHFGEFIAHRSSPGVIIIPQHLPIAAAAEGLVLIWSASHVDEWVDRVFWLNV